MSLIEKLTSIKTKLTKLLSDCNTALVAKGAAEVTSLAEVPTAIESVQSGGSGGVETIDDYEAYYTRPSWWLPYPELTEGDDINEIFLLMEVEPEVMEYDGIDLSNTAILRNGKKQFWKKVESNKLEGVFPDLLEIHANCVNDWYVSHSSVNISVIGASSISLTMSSVKNANYYPKLQLISGTPMRITSQSNTFPLASNLRLIQCLVKISAVSSCFPLSGIVKMPEIENMYTSTLSMIMPGCFALNNAGNLTFLAGSNFFTNCINLQRVHFNIGSGTVSNTFVNCARLKYVTVEKGFSGSLYLNYSTQYTSEILHKIIENYADCTGMETAPTFQVGTTNLAKIDDEHKEMLSAKGIEYS